MNNSKQSHHEHGGSESDSGQKARRRYWKRAHHDWRFWVALLLMFAGMALYVMSDDFAFLSRSRQQTPASDAVGQ
jgi:hypothetical protein